MAKKTDLAPVIEASVQTPPTDDEVGGRNFAFMFFNLAHDGALIAPWWSRTRDNELRALVKKVDYLSGAVYALQSFMTTIPFRIEPKDKSVRAHADLAEKFQEMLEDGSEFGDGWETFYSKSIEDLLTQDNGWAFEIIGAGDPLGPIVGMPLGVKHMDISRVQRTGNPEFPVIYTSVDGSIHRLHFTRVGLTSQMPSPDVDMNGVGFSAVSRVVNVAINLYDILIFKQERLGSRPARNLLVTQGGLDPDDLKTAFTVSEEIMDSQNLSRYSKSVVIGDASLPDADIKSVDLTSLPDGFDEETSISLGMATIALGFGVDARELFPAMSTGATKADALISHVKSRGKAKGQILKLTERIFGQKVLPPSLKMVFDFQDDVQDKAVADIREIRAKTHEANLNSGVVDVRVIREQMMSDGDLTREQFIQLELEDGRMEDGTDLLVLFNSKLHRDILNLGIPNPLNVDDNDAEAVLELIADRRVELIEDLSVEGMSGMRKRIVESLAALKRLEAEYEGEQDQEIADPLLQSENGDEPEGEPAMEETETELDVDEEIKTRPFWKRA